MLKKPSPCARKIVPLDRKPTSQWLSAIFILAVNKERHTTIILTTHDVSDIETLCEKMIVIDKGNLLYDGTLTELKSLYKTTDLEDIIKKIYLQGMIERVQGVANA